ncbi:hypothetical protein [Tunicatimonas pelagia]|uniref:hypothetical protein n=1 Tax=Tunicatimonas pelagia TaxID=931531 RepID=UPI002665A62A|nr:hypothetical protein [Tunicatimonas pelagia]WKN40957.1 hypothetical protein P0M28_18145 [Tunicatimonas pelagia]
MELTTIRELVEKYWNGETSLEEEAQLQRYFQEEEAPADLKKEAALFRYYQANTQSHTLNEQFDEQLTQRIEREQTKQRWLTYQPLLRIAAAVVLVIMAAILFRTEWMDEANPVATEDTYEDPRLAYEQTREALLLVSSLMNEGTQHIQELETFSEAQETIKTQIP